MMGLCIIISAFIIASGVAHTKADHTHVYYGLCDVAKAINNLAEAVRESESWPPEKGR
jgi:hypothetical protein